MKKKKKFTFSTETTPTTEITMSGRYGQPLDLSLSSSKGELIVSLDPESIIRLQAFLTDYLQDSGDEDAECKKIFRPTGRALSLMDGDTLDILRVYVSEDFQNGLDEKEPAYADILNELSEKEGMNMPSRPFFILFDVFDGIISRSKLRRIIRACIAFQIDFVKSGDFSKCRRMRLEDIEAFTNIDLTHISRTTKNVRILTKDRTYTLNSRDISMTEPSLFDEGIDCLDGSTCSRKEVLAAIEYIISLEDPRKPLTDEHIREELNKRGYVFSRRTVVKYREILGISNSHVRKVR